MRKSTVVLILFILTGCAQQVPLSGGPKDTYAPAIDSAKTFPSNGQLNFTGNEIEMKFKEYIKLNKPNDNIIITPQQENAPEITSKNKKLSIKFADELKENTTYTITFNGAVQDITERNDSVFQYVFSTGDYIDSLKVSGKVIDAFKNKGEKGLLVGLYPYETDVEFDSIPFKVKPTYLAQTDENGLFEMNYLKDGEYYVFALDDRNKNLLLESNEKRAFLGKQTINLYESIDSLLLKSFLPKQSGCEIEDTEFSFPGSLKILLSNPADTFSLRSTLDLLKEETGSKDSLIYWLDQNPKSKMRFYTYLNGELDTLKPIYKNIPDKIEDVKLKWTHNVKKGKLLPEENLKIHFSEPLGQIELSGIHAFDKDSIQVEISDVGSEVLDLDVPTFGTRAHEVIIDSGAVTSVYGRINDKEIRILLDNHESDYYASLILNVDTLFLDQVIVHLLDSKGVKVREQDFNQKLTFDELLPGDYQLRLIFDVDANGEWSTGSLEDAIEPENVIYYSGLVNVKSKWEKEVDWNFK
ncbi:MAG: hypothetical protein ACI857_001749 [Arenicella sp.]|jgi:hypothetical protein